MYDVVVVGAGPAGSTCARICAGKGLKTALLDKEKFPRQKPCAGAVSVQALSLLDFILPDGVVEKECFGAQIGYNGRSAEIRKDRLIAVLVSRNNFDRLLAQKAVENGAQFLEGENVVEVCETGSSVIVLTATTSYQTRFLIGADGVHSRVAHAVRPPFRKDELALAALSQPRALDDEIDSALCKKISFQFGIAPLGYGWLFPHRGYYSLGAAGIASRFLNAREAVSQYAQSVHIEPESLRGHFIPLGGIKRKIACNRILLGGDAAGFADPIHGEGIVHAIRSGKFAAEAVIDGIKRNRAPREIAADYTLLCERNIRKQLGIALWLARLIDRYPELLVRIFIDNKRALEQYVEIASGRSDYRRFLKWILVRLPFYLLSSYAGNFRISRERVGTARVKCERERNPGE